MFRQLLRLASAASHPSTSTSTAAASLRRAAFSHTARSMGVDKVTTKPGDGVTFPKAGQKVTAHYTGTLTDGTKFDSSVDKGRPFVFTIGVGQVIKGWDEGMAQMSVGEKATLTCSPDYGYGKAGAGGVIPPNATLIFEVELLKVE